MSEPVDELRKEQLRASRELAELLERDPPTSLVALALKAARLAALTEYHEYRILFELHLNGWSNETTQPDLRVSKWPNRGIRPEFDPFDAFAADRKLPDGLNQGQPLEQLEKQAVWLTNLRVEAERDDRNPYYKTLAQMDIGLQSIVAKIRNRIALFSNTVVVRLLRSQPTSDGGSLSPLGLPNLQQLTLDLGRLVEKATHPISLAFADLDNLKALNGMIGHDAADEVIAELASRLRSACSGRCTAYHRSGDEFLLVLENHTATESASFIQRQLAHVTGRPFPSRAGEQQVTLSVGIAELPLHARSAEELREKAQSAVKMAKQDGKARVAIWSA